MINTIIFDFDGLIRDTETNEFYSFQELLKEYGIELPLELYNSRIGGRLNLFDPYEYLQRRTGEILERELLKKKRRESYNKLMVNQKALPGVQNYLSEAKKLGLNIGLASSATYDWVFSNLEELELTKYFSCIRTNDDVINVKPSPDLYLQVLDYFGVEPFNAIAFEDSPNGAKSAKSAGVYCVIVPNELTKNLAFEDYDIRLNSLAQIKLKELIKMLTYK